MSRSEPPISDLDSALRDRYRIRRELGAGGMATVYLADDLRHERKVALKVLEPELAAVVGAERFLAEIKTTAKLQHPHILPLFDSGQADGVLFYAMPYVEGESLRDRLDREHQLPVDEAVAIATNVAEALDYAHRQGIVHRDIKPGNVLMTDGKAVVSDFGIALAVGAAGVGRLTETGMSLGTPHYMSPEQATGDESTGPRTDVYALGCILYEMLTGEPPFTGSTPQAVLGRIITGEAPSATAQRSTVPANVDAAIRKALEKIPADRFPRAEDLARALADPGFRHREAEPRHSGRSSSLLVPTLAALSVALAGALLWTASRDPPSGPPERFVIPFEPGMEPRGGGGEWWISPDGRALVYATRSTELLRLRSLTDLHSTPLPGTGGASALSPGAVSPDGRELAFRADGEIRVVPLAGGPTRTLMEGRTAGWGDDGYVYVTTNEGLDRVPAEGGEPEAVTRLAEGEVIHRFTDAVPGGILIEVDRGQRRSVELVDLSAFERTVLVPDGTDGRWLEEGYLAYLVGGALTADVYDHEARRVDARPVVLVTDVSSFAVSSGGRLVYREGGGGPGPLEFVWVSRSGETEPVDERWFAMDGVNIGWRLGADDREILFSRWVEGNWDVWILETPSGELRRLTEHPARDFVPRWSPGGSEVTFGSVRAGSEAAPFSLWSVPRDGGQAPTLLFGHQPVAAGVWSPDGRWLVVRTTTGPQGASVNARDILGIRPGVDSVPLPLAASPDAEELEPEVSPDGRWLAYTSNQTGSAEVWVQPFPESDRSRWQISVEGGMLPLWSRQDGELFFVRPDSRELVSVRYDTTASGFRVVSREALFVIPPDVHLQTSSEAYDVSSDGRRFLMARTPAGLPSSPPRRLFVIDDWVHEVERRLSR